MLLLHVVLAAGVFVGSLLVLFAVAPLLVREGM
jgi:hypothetical protein